MNEERIAELTARAKECNDYTADCTIGEAAYLETLIVLIKEWRTGKLETAKLAKKQKELEEKLINYYQHSQLFDLHIAIYNRYSEVLTDAVKHGCPICKRLVDILDGKCV